MFNQFCFLTPPCLFTAQMVFITSSHGNLIWWWRILILMALKCPLSTVKHLSFAQVARVKCASKLMLNHGDLVWNPDMVCSDTLPERFVVKVQKTPSLQELFEFWPPPKVEFNMHSHSEVCKFVLTRVCMELADLPEVLTMNFDKRKKVTEPITRYCASFPPTTSSALERYMQIKRALCLALLPQIISLISFSVICNLFRRQWKQLITLPQRFFRGTHRRFLHIVIELAADGM